MIKEDIILGFQIIALIIYSFVFKSALFRYRNKKSFLSRNLFLAFLFIWLGIIFQIIGSILIKFQILSVISLSNSYSSFDIDINNSQYWIMDWIIFIFQRGKFSSFSLLIAIYFFYRFSRYVFDGQGNYLEKTFKDKVMLFVLISIVCFGVINYFIFRSDLPILFKFYSQSAIYTVIFIWVVMVPIFIHGFKLVKFLIHKNESYERILYLTLMSACFIIGLFCYLTRNIFSFFMGTFYNFLYLSGGALVIIASIFAYLSFYSKRIPVYEKPTNKY